MKHGIILALAVSVAGCGSSVPGEMTNYGRRPDWSATLPGGKKVTAADYDKKVVIVDFWATWCPPCRKEIPGFIQLQKTYKDQGLEVIGFSLDREKDVYDQWVKEQGLNYLSIYSENEKESEKLVESFQKLVGEISGIPTTLVIDRKGNIVYKHVGFGEPEDFERIIKPLLAEKA